VQITWVCSDTGSGAVSASIVKTLTADGADQSESAYCTDNVGNTSGVDVVSDVDIDKTAPSITITSPTATDYAANSSHASAYSCTDVTSGTASCAGPVADGANFDTSTFGAHAFTVNAADAAGNVASRTVNYNVHYQWSGLRRPIDPWPTYNKVKAGQSVPVKFSLGGFQGMNIFVEMNGVQTPASNTIACDSNAEVDPIETVATAGSSGLNYDASADQYNYIWKTNGAWSNTCRQLVLKLNDGRVVRANFKLTK
jgi:hypothetical protein